MSKTEAHAWRSDLCYYKELIGVECEQHSDFECLVKALFEEGLCTCPREVIVDGNTIVIPKEAVRFLPLKHVKHKKVALRHTMSLNEKVIRELSCRFSAGRKEKEKPHYYITGNTCLRYLVLSSTVQEIESSCG